MKYVLVFGLAWLVIWLWRRHRIQGPDGTGRSAGQASSNAKGITPMVECEVCKVHLPQADAITGASGGVYCSEAHRRQSGG